MACSTKALTTRCDQRYRRPVRYDNLNEAFYLPPCPACPCRLLTKKEISVWKDSVFARVGGLRLLDHFLIALVVDFAQPNRVRGLCATCRDGVPQMDCSIPKKITTSHPPEATDYRCVLL